MKEVQVAAETEPNCPLKMEAAHVSQMFKPNILPVKIACGGLFCKKTPFNSLCGNAVVVC
jgi:hypothetical protein